MGRHGGGSRSGGRRSSSGSSGGSDVKNSSTPFKGCYNRSYYYRGACHSYYTKDKDFGISKSRIISKLIGIIFLNIIMLLIIMESALSIVHSGGKVNGNPSRMVIKDTIDLLTAEEEQRVLELFDQVYSKSGMPITLYTDDMEWKDKYSSIEVYSEELYYAMGIEENAMIILFTYDGTFDWVYDMYCGDDTIKCLSDNAFNKLIDNFQKGMAGQDLCYALDYSLNSIMDDLAEKYVDSAGLPVLFFIIFYYLFIFAVLYSSYSEEKRAYKYFQENPEKVDNTPMLVKNECPSCGAHNTNLLEVCEYCGSVLKM